MSDRRILIIAFGTVILNLVIGRFLAPAGMLMTPAMLVIVSMIVGFGTRALKPMAKSLFTFGLISLHDIGIKLYAGGYHDNEGQGLVHLLLLIGLVPSFGILVAGILRDRSQSGWRKVIAIMVFVCLVVAHLAVFMELGVGRSY